MTAEFRPLLTRYFSRRLSERAEVEDLLQEVLTRLPRSPRPEKTHVVADFAAERVLLGQEELNRASALLLELPERTRAIFVLRRLEGLRHSEIATRLGISVSTVEKQMCMALEYLIEGMKRP